MPHLRCSYCGASTHSVNLCPKTWGGQANRKRLRCTYCGGLDHSNEGCPKLGKRPKPGTYRLD